MRKKLSAVIAHALHDAGVLVATHVPGYGVSEVFSEYCELSKREHPISFNEEVAYSITHGASLVGGRAASLMKVHGFLKACNSVSDSLYAGTTAGFVTVIFDDPRGTHSDSILDATAVLEGIGIPHRVVTAHTMYQDVLRCFDESERFQIPYALLVNSDELQQLVDFESRRFSAYPNLHYQRDITQHVLCPCFSAHQREVLAAKQRGADWTRLQPPAIPHIPESLPERWKPVAESYAPLFSVFQSLRGAIVTGDTGVSSLFAFPPYSCVDITTYMGGSIPLAIGAFMAGFDDVWALTGDFSFIAAGQLGLPEAVQRHIPLKIVLFYNGTAETTGGQPIPAGTLERIIRGYGRFVRYINDPSDRRELGQVLTEVHDSNELRIVIADYR
jgi:TPP-dependent indolepyruvate ferredoxin oxidoreductase alpha subunit